MEKKQDDGVRNITRGGINRMTKAMESQNATITIISRQLRKEIQDFEDSLGLNPEKQKRAN
jgi:hypothetical protein